MFVGTVFAVVFSVANPFERNARIVIAFEFLVREADAYR